MIKIEMQQQVCPYTGLRSFTEDESLYFKGRDLQIRQIISLLEENKFLMVTGASGEGKSSVIYAGLIPNARAGFFKAKYTNWIVADFRPERSPLQNMSKSLADKFSLNHVSVETELKRGFSSLADLYVSSEFFIDETDNEWTNLDEQSKRDKKRKAANLLVLVDQFEEFFTNPENFNNEFPSQESQTVVNLILETSRIAMKRNLPIYIVCTMRSDYIGQCSAFRGLPEYIGFSQFFVPRLKRKDLKQVIEEPAVLSGNRISQRLIERLVFDLADGIDQLPILQHALSQIWLMASSGNEEMDLIHYAKVGGMPADELPEEDQEVFSAWFTSLEASTRLLYKETGLNQVIEIHANMLYESAFQLFCKRYPEHPITIKDTKRIIGMAFACLTKIDHSRAVRNRMTLREITDIVNEPSLDTNIVGKVLEVFREEGNSLIRPFKTEDASTHTLSDDAVLDITHESLIRSWGRLQSWVSKEFEFYTNYLDFKKQLDRWKESDKSSGYLLPIGPLSFFENWYAKCRPNIGWIRRYTEADGHAEQKPAEILADTKDFLKRSARKVIVTRAFMKYGSQRIATILSIVIMLSLTGFYWYDAVQKQNDKVIAKLKDDGHALLASEYVDDFVKGGYLITEERYTRGSMMNSLHKQLDLQQGINQANNSYFGITVLDKKFHNSVKNDLIQYLHDAFEKANFSANREFFLDQRILFVLRLAYDHYYNPGGFLEKELKHQSSALHDMVVPFFNDPRLYNASITPKLNKAIHLWLAFGDADARKINDLIALIEDPNVFSIYYPRSGKEPNGVRALEFSGGYHLLACLYATAGKTEKVIESFGHLVAQSDYWTNLSLNNFSNVIGYLYQFGHRPKVTDLIKWITQNTRKTEEEIYNELIARSAYISHLYRVNYDFTELQDEGSLQTNLCLGGPSLTNEINSDYEKYLSLVQDQNRKNFLTAVHLKRKAIFAFKYNFDRDLPFDEKTSDQLFSESLKHFAQVSDNFLNEKILIGYPVLAGSRKKEWTRREFYIYPDFMGDRLNLSYHSTVFFNYLRKNGALDDLYKSGADLNAIHYWLTNAFEVRPFSWFEGFRNTQVPTDSVLRNILSYVSSHRAGATFDKNLIWVVLTNRAFNRGDVTTGLSSYKEINFENITQWVNKYENVNSNFLLNEIRYLGAYLAGAGKHEESVRIAEKFDPTDEKIFSYLHSANRAYDKEQYTSAFALLDSACSKFKSMNAASILPFRDYRYTMIYTFSKFGGKEMSAMANQMVNDMMEGRKFDAIYSKMKGQASTGNFYDALSDIPSTMTDEQDIILRGQALFRAADLRGKDKDFEHVLDWDLNWDYVLYGNFRMD